MHSEEEISRLYIMSYLAAFTQGVYEFTLPNVVVLCCSSAWRDQTTGKLIDSLEDFGNRLVEQVCTTEKDRVTNFVLHLSRDSWADELSDFPGLISPSAPECTRYLLSSRGAGWSTYYKGYLAMSVVVRTMAGLGGEDGQADNMFRILGILKRSGADLASRHPYKPRDHVLAVRSPAARLLLHATGLLLDGVNESGLRFVWSTLDILADVAVEDEELSLFCRFGRDIELSRSWEYWSSSSTPVHHEEYAICMATFSVQQLRGAMQEVYVSVRGGLIGHEGWYDSFSRVISAPELVSGLFRQQCARLQTRLHICVSHLEGPANFLQAVELTVADLDHMKKLIFEHQEEDVYHELIRSRDGQRPPQVEDIDFNISWDDVRRYVLPLDPNEVVGPDEWKEKGLLRRYSAAQRRRFDSVPQLTSL